MGLRGGRYGGVPVGRAPMTDASFAVSIIGPLEVLADGEHVEITQPRLRQLLALLALRADDGCTTRELADELWPHHLPANPRQAIQIAVSRLRTALGDAAAHLATRPEGYALVDVCIDAHQLTERVDEAIRALEKSATDDVAPPAASADDLVRLLDSWRGEPLVDVPTTPMLERWCSDLRGIRDSAERCLVEMLVQVGRFDEAVIRARSILDCEPTDEAAARSLALALARSGHKAEALHVLDRLRAALRNELGIDPSPSILAVERDVLNGAVALEPVRPPIRSHHSFVGRAAEFDALADPDRPRLVVLRGPSGIGKTKLLRLVVDRQRAAGRRLATCDVVPRATRPLEPVRTIIEQLQDLAHDDGDADPVARWARSPGHDPPPGSSRDECIELLATRISTVCKHHHVHLVIDDAQWLDRTSAAVIERLVKLDGFDLTISTRPDAHCPWAGLAGARNTIELGPFDSDAVLAFLTANLPRLAGPAEAHSLLRRSGGNPLLLSLLVDGLAEGTMSTGELPVNLLMAAAERLSALPTEVQRTLEVAAVIGHEFDISLVATVRPAPYPDLLVAAAAGLVHLDGPTGSFAHGVIGEAAHQLIPPVRRIDLHDLIGAHLLEHGAAASVYADHFDHAADLDAHRAACARLDAGDEHLAAHDLAGARASFQIALGHAERVAPCTLTATILLRLGLVERRLGDAEHADHLRRAIDLARSVGADDVYFEAVVELCRHGESSQIGADDESVAHLLTEALQSGPPPELEVQLCAAAATVLSFTASTARGRELFRSAWSTARSSGDEQLEAAVLLNTHLGLSDPDDLDQREDAAERLRTLSGEDADRCWECAFLDFTHSLMRGNGPAASDALERMRLLHETPKAQPRDFGMAFCESTWSTIEGRLDEAEEHANRALAIGSKRYPASWAFATYGALLVAIRDAAGDAGSLLPAVEQAVHEFPEETNLRGALAYVAALNGDHRRARRELSSLVTDSHLPLLRDLTWSGTITLAARGAAIVGDERFARLAADALTTSTGRMSFLGVTTVGPVDEALAEIAAATGDLDTARARLDSSLEIVDRLGATVYESRLDALGRRLSTA